MAFGDGRSRTADGARDPHAVDHEPATSHGDADIPCSFDLGRVAMQTASRQPVRPKLRISRPGDRLEEEADRIADEVVRGITAGGGTDDSPARDGERPVAAAPLGLSASPAPASRASFTSASLTSTSSASGIGEAPPSVERTIASPGAPMAAEVRERMEERIGLPFDGVRIHTDGAASDSANEIGARAYTVGESIVFASGEYRPGTIEGDRLLAHELTHVAQQGARQGPQPGARPGGQGAPLVQRQPDGHDDPPGTIPGAYVVDGGLEMTIDSDGDYKPDLVLLFKELPDGNGKQGKTKRIQLEIKHKESGVKTQVDVSWPWVAVNDELLPNVVSMTDGRGPTVIALTTNSKAPHILSIDPPTIAEGTQTFTGTADKVPFQLMVATTGAPVEKKPNVTADDMLVQGGSVSSRDLTLGPYNDRFRISIQAYNDSLARIAFTGLNGNEPRGFYGADIPFTASVYRPDPNAKLRSRGKLIPKPSGDTGLAFDIDGDDKVDIRIYDVVSANRYSSSGPEGDRGHTVRLVHERDGAVVKEYVFGFRKNEFGVIDGGFQNPNELDAYAYSESRAAGTLSEQRKEGGYEDQLLSLEIRLVQLRRTAMDRKVISREMFDAWVALANQVTPLRPAMTSGKPIDEATKGKIREAASTFYDALRKETSSGTSGWGAPLFGGIVYSSSNEYTGASSSNFGATDPGADLQAAIDTPDWKLFLTRYDALVKGLDAWIAHMLESGSYQRDMDDEIKAVDKAREPLEEIREKNPKRIFAAYYPDPKFEKEKGYVAEVPLQLYYWREGDTWYLKDLTNSEDTYKFSAKANDAETGVPYALLHDMGQHNRFPIGIIHFEIPGPGGYAGTVRTESTISFSQILGYIAAAIGLAALGLSLAVTGGATSLAIPAYVTFVMSLAAGTTAAVAHMVDEASHDNLSATEAILDISTIVASFAGAAALRSGRVIVAGVRASQSGIGLTEEMASSVGTALRYYKIARYVENGANVVGLVTYTAEVADQIEAIRNTYGDSGEQARAISLLLAQLAITGSLVAYSFHGEIPTISESQSLVVENMGTHYGTFVGDNVAMAHPTTEGAPVTNYTKTSFTLTRQQQVSYLAANVTGMTEEQATFLLKLFEQEGATMVIGGSRMRGNARVGENGVLSDFDIGFKGITQNRFTKKIAKPFNEKFPPPEGGSTPITDTFIFPGSKSKVKGIGDIVSPEEFFLRSGVRVGNDQKAGQRFEASGYILMQPDGVTEIGRP